MKLQEAKTTSGNKCVTQGKTQTTTPFTHKCSVFLSTFLWNKFSRNLTAKFTVWGLELSNSQKTETRWVQKLLRLKGFTYVQVRRVYVEKLNRFGTKYTGCPKKVTLVRTECCSSLGAPVQPPLELPLDLEKPMSRSCFFGRFILRLSEIT